MHKYCNINTYIYIYIHTLINKRTYLQIYYFIYTLNDFSIKKKKKRYEWIFKRLYKIYLQSLEYIFSKIKRSLKFFFNCCNFKQKKKRKIIQFLVFKSSNPTLMKTTFPTLSTSTLFSPFPVIPLRNFQSHSYPTFNSPRPTIILPVHRLNIRPAIISWKNERSSPVLLSSSHPPISPTRIHHHAGTRNV